MFSHVYRLIQIDRRSNVSISNQVLYELQSLISNKKLVVGDILPSVESFASFLNISTQHIEKAYQKLYDNRFLEKQVDGSFCVGFYELVTDYKTSFYVITDRIEAMGLKLEIRPLEVKVIQMPNKALEHIGYPNEEKIIYMKRLYCGDQRPFFLAEHYLPLSIFPTLEHILKGDEKIYPLMNAVANITTINFKRVAEALCMDVSLASIFSVKVGSAYLKLESVGVDDLNRQVEFSRVCLLGNYTLNLKTPRSDIKM
jgi:DNA-binding GntR family transcriptional regulator